jgi:glycerophosphoryl diester phosphodiesterase
MSATHRISPRQRGGGCLAILFLVLVAYYGVQVWLRTPALTEFQIIAHRGGSTNAPENTLAAFQNAITLGVDWLEFDVQMTKDGALVVIHDETVDRTTEGTGAVRDLSLEEIRSLDAGQGEKVPTFEEVVQLAKTNGVRILPEMKSANLYPGIEEKLLQELEQADYLDQTVIQSFNADSLERLHRLNPQAKLCALYGLNPGLILQAHQEGRQVFIWFSVIENPFGLSFMRFFGADGLIVDDPTSVRER